MKILFVLFASLLMCSITGCGGDDNIVDEQGEHGAAAVAKSWHELEQYQRNQKILEVALEDYSKNVKLSCKEWIRDVIKRASNGHVIIPSNTESGDSWVPDPEDHVVRYRYNTETALLNTSPGDIVQMQWNPGVGSDDAEYNMHTAIIFSVTSKGVLFIESNYDKTPKDVSDAVVNIRFETETKFQEEVEAFSVFSIR